MAQDIIKIAAEYNQQRKDYAKGLPVCLAPFNNLYFKSSGVVSPCWLYAGKSGKYPLDSLQDIWIGSIFDKIRSAIKRLDFDSGCSECKKDLANNNFKNFLGAKYDCPYTIDGYPKIMEFELSNKCNLDCVMCRVSPAFLSRENWAWEPPEENIYDESFVKQLVPFIPYLEEARFNGGEPFLIDIYYDIWAEILRIKPSIKICVATNGTILAERTKAIMEKGMFYIGLSLDSLEPKNYESIRRNASLETTLKNMNYFIDYCRRKKTLLTIVVNPMRFNWHEMPSFVELGNTHDVPIEFNTIRRPENVSLWALSAGELTNIYDSLSKTVFSETPEMTQHQRYNISRYNHLVHVQIKNWVKDAQDRENSKNPA
jgi:MoaA/NifB/PqqE/SkfB family radical SAM enzyme